MKLQSVSCYVNLMFRNEQQVQVVMNVCRVEALGSKTNEWI